MASTSAQPNVSSLGLDYKGHPILSDEEIAASGLTPLSVWRHRKGGLYVVLGVSLCSTNGDRDTKEQLVIYHSVTYKRLRHRDVHEWLDGRFELVSDVPPPLSSRVGVRSEEDDE